MSNRIEISKENNKIWHAQKLVGDNPDLNYYAIDIKDSGLDELDDADPIKNRGMIVWVHKTTLDVGLEYMGEKAHATNYTKGSLMTNPANKRGLRDKVIELFNRPELNDIYVIVTGSIDDD